MGIGQLVLLLSVSGLISKNSMTKCMRIHLEVNSPTTTPQHAHLHHSTLSPACSCSSPVFPIDMKEMLTGLPTQNSQRAAAPNTPVVTRMGAGFQSLGLEETQRRLSLKGEMS